MSDSVEQSIVQVLTKGDGLGVISNEYIFTAAHCLDVDFEGGIALGDFRFQTCKTCDGQDFQADLLFVEAVFDFAVLVRPDEQACWREAEAYDQAIDGRGIELYRGEIPLSDANPMAVRIRNKNGWVDGKASTSVGRRAYIKASKQIDSGASGGPVINFTSNELVAINSQYNDDGVKCGGVQPLITQAMPVWLARELLAENRVCPHEPAQGNQD